MIVSATWEGKAQIRHMGRQLNSSPFRTNLCAIWNSGVVCLWHKNAMRIKQLWCDLSIMKHIEMLWFQFSLRKEDCVVHFWVKGEAPLLKGSQAWQIWASSSNCSACGPSGPSQTSLVMGRPWNVWVFTSHQIFRLNSQCHYLKIDSLFLLSHY